MANISSSEILNYLGLDENSIESIDSFRSTFESDYVKKSVARDPKSNEYKELMPAYIGKVTGSTQTALNRKLKDFGVEIDSAEVQGKRIEDVVDYGIDKLGSTLQSRIAELENKLSKSTDDLQRESEVKLQSLSKKYSELEAAHATLKNEYATTEDTWRNKLKGERIANLMAKEHEKIKWKTGVRDIEREGFFARIANNYKVDYDEQAGTLDVFDSNGNRIANGKKSGTWKTYAEILEEEGVRSEVWTANEAANKTNAKQTTFGVRSTMPTNANNTTQTQHNDGRLRKISSRVK